MPRPGPRPYECVRRAWHSDRHQPMRGSLIQEIFRIANEIHSPVTKKNKEWQEKLPIVVLKAEEIIYSKANSEAEYMDLKTLWDRVNDAINTIIRRDESSEVTGEFLQPCIEAALHLGCVPRRATRSQRNNHPRGYLTGNVDLPTTTQGNPKSHSPLTPHYSNLLSKEPRNLCVPSDSCINNVYVPSDSCINGEIYFLSKQKCLPLEGSLPSKSYPVYPLYYGIDSQPTQSQPYLEDHLTPNAIKDPPEPGISQTFTLSKEEIRCSSRDLQKNSDDQPNDECDLSLRLGFATVKVGEDVGSLRCREKANVGAQRDSEERLSLCFENNAGVELMMRKRKAVEQMKDQRYSWHPKLMSSYSNGGTKTAGL